MIATIYMDYYSFHPKHIKDNVPFGLAKRILCFVTNPSQMESRINQLKTWLLSCHYPVQVINKSIHNARLQGPAPKPADKKMLFLLLLLRAHLLNCLFLVARPTQLFKILN